MTFETPNYEKVDRRLREHFVPKVRTGEWDPMVTKLSIFWNELKNHQYYKLMLPYWHEELKAQYNNPNSVPVVLTGTTIGGWLLQTGRVLEENTSVKISFWQGIYTEWERCVQKPTALDATRPVIITIYKKGRKHWIINEVEQR